MTEIINNNHKSSKCSDDFSEQILAELIKEGYSSESMLKELEIRQLKVKNSIKSMTKEADDASIDKTEYMTMDDVFEE